MFARLSGLRAAEKAAGEIKTEPPKGLPGIDLGSDSGKTKKQRQDISAQLRDAQLAAIGLYEQLDPVQEIALQREAKLLEIKEKQLLPNERIVAEAKVNKAAEEAIQKIVNKTASDVIKITMARRDQNERIEESIEKLQIEAGIKDQSYAQQIEKQKFIQQLEKDGRKLTKQELADIDEAYKKINEKTSESMQLFKQIGQNVVSALSDAFMSLFDQTKSLREVLTDLLRSTARLFVEFGLRAGMKGLFPSLFATGGIMTGNGPVALKRYASGGIANSPQLAMFGEGSTPEAYVPLPDGRSIPVKMKGGGEGGNITVNVDARGTSVQGDNDQGARLGRAISAAVQQELIRQRRPGGLLT